MDPRIDVMGDKCKVSLTCTLDLFPSSFDCTESPVIRLFSTPQEHGLQESKTIIQGT